MRTVLAACLLAVASVAFAADCPKCSAGTTPAKGYFATFSTGQIVTMVRGKDLPCTWTAVPGPVSCDFHHMGWLAAHPGPGLAAPPRVYFRLFQGFGDPIIGTLDVTEIRDGNGPWTLTLKDIRGKATGATVTITPIP